MQLSFSSIVASVWVAACFVQGARAQKEGVPPEAAARLAALPSSTQGKAIAAPDITVTLKHTAPADAKCADPKIACDEAAHWVVELKTPTADRIETVPLSEDAELRQKLTAAAAPKAKKHGEVVLSDAKLSIRAAPGTAFRSVQNLMQAAARSTIHAIEFAVSAPSGVAEQRLVVPLPTDVGVEFVNGAPKKTANIPLRLAVDPGTGHCIRDFGKHTVASDAAGDAELHEWLVKSADGWKRLGDENAPVVLTVEPRVSLQAVVAVIDACHEHRLEVQFKNPDVTGDEKK